ncbi:hypothetical protein V8C86DRAFT_52118 [Haematococcus lacustris]
MARCTYTAAFVIHADLLLDCSRAAGLRLLPYNCTQFYFMHACSIPICPLLHTLYQPPTIYHPPTRTLLQQVVLAPPLIKLKQLDSQAQRKSDGTQISKLRCNDTYYTLRSCSACMLPRGCLARPMSAHAVFIEPSTLPCIIFSCSFPAA